MSFDTPADDTSASHEDRPSKSQRKREMQALQDLGEKIIALSEAERARLPLSDDMRFAVEETGRIRSHEGRRRHMQYVGKLMRREDTEAIQAAFEAFEQEKLRRDHAFHRLEKWRERLIDEGDEALEAFIAEFPDVDRQTLRQLIRNAKSERKRGKPPANARKLFRLIRDTAGL
ncbi:ribosome biogenesis factor YjgA [Litchfieldella rifensis]|uniref:Dual-action ribosomal maturation protein DarP n=1 Tax=Litchfieldella rifensis TaxID=762643 RepID=A0ABV7LN26_9GAMM